MKSNSRSKKAFINIVFSVLSELIKLACGLILPRLILSNYGSEYNGIVQSVSQFLSCIALMKMGIGDVTRAALFKPLANKDPKEISEVLYSTEKFMRRIALIFVVFTLVFACSYPAIVKNNFGWFFSFSLIIIISIATFAEYYFGFTYQMLLSADQRDFVLSSLSMFTIVANAIVSVILINNNCSIHVVKLGSSLVNLVTPLFLYIYCHKKYKLVKVEYNKNKLPQRWAALSHELASFVNDNTNIMILSILTNLLEVSVFTVYQYVIRNLKTVATSLTTSFGSAFGDMYAKKEDKLMIENIRIYELITYTLSSIIYSSTFVLIVPFILVYTKGIYDADYSRVGFAIVFTLAGMFDSFRYPYKSIIKCTGHFKETKNIAILEAVINIVVSIICTWRFGMIGVAIGSFLTMLFGSLQYSYFLNKNIIKRDYKEIYLHMSLTLLTAFLVRFISSLYMGEINNYLVWFEYAIITGIISLVITLVVDVIFYREDSIKLLNKFKTVVLKR